VLRDNPVGHTEEVHWSKSCRDRAVWISEGTVFLAKW
jgi:hypothetical protein